MHTKITHLFGRKSLPLSSPGDGDKMYPSLLFWRQFSTSQTHQRIKKKKSTSNNYARALVFAKKESIPSPPIYIPISKKVSTPLVARRWGQNVPLTPVSKTILHLSNTPEDWGYCKQKQKKTVPAKDFFYDDTLGQLFQHGKKIEIDLEIDEMNKLLLNNDAYVKW